jgi:hypothetical protein
LISTAQSSIELSPNFAGGKAFCEILDLIAIGMSKHPQLRVHLILSKDLLEDLDRGKLEELAQNEQFVYLVTDRLFYPHPFVHTEENHVKLLIVDGKYFVMGGSGIHPKMIRDTYSHENMGNEKSTFAAQFVDQAFHDADLVGTGEAVGELRHHFFGLFSKWEERTLAVKKNRFFPLRKRFT